MAPKRLFGGKVTPSRPDGWIPSRAELVPRIRVLIPVNVSSPASEVILFLFRSIVPISPENVAPAKDWIALSTRSIVPINPANVTPWKEEILLLARLRRG